MGREDNNRNRVGLIENNRGSKNLSLLLAIALLLVSSCLEREKRISSEGESTTLLNFRANYHSIGKEVPLITKGETSLPPGIEGSIYIYLCGEDPNRWPPHPQTPLLTLSNGRGELILKEGELFYLTMGSYDFYALGNCGESLDKTLNGVDYLWAKVERGEIEGESTLIHFNFSHIALKIEIELEEELDALLLSATITPPREGGRIDLYSGTIEAAQRVSSESLSMELSGGGASALLLPLLEGIALPIELELEERNLKGELSRVYYRAELPSPSGGFIGGRLYRYWAIKSLEEIIFNKCTIKPWSQVELQNLHLDEKE